MALPPNLFKRLHKWASRQDENFLTESLAVLLEVLLEREGLVALRLIRELTGGFIGGDIDNVETIEVRTQVSIAEGRPDLEIRDPGHLAVVEVKCESEVQRGQLEGYREFLRTSQAGLTKLILLAKYPPSLAADAEKPDLIVRWYELADAIEGELQGSALTDPVCRFLCTQFHDFLKERNMAIAQVGWQMSEGSRALRNFLVMLQEAATACRLSARQSLTLENAGFTLEGGKYWLGLNFEEPDKLWFGTRCQIDVKAAEALGEGSIESDVSWVPGGHRWWRVGELESEKVHFYNRSKVGQMQWLETFLRESLEFTRRIELPQCAAEPTADQPNPPN